MLMAPLVLSLMLGGYLMATYLFKVAPFPYILVMVAFAFGALGLAYSLGSDGKS